ncbi:hypothetical protein B0A55_03487 [Friedmanniomyces simplex]|uniref:Uncharacterized protein n=1 Tax=Friedmanniomyces simplex TaxID=329884 RepID=A0A4V5NHI3_9PEZI|nr:hypothetical protein B0A55_03487 [Friedmanniomyces simplex]
MTELGFPPPAYAANSDSIVSYPRPSYGVFPPPYDSADRLREPEIVDLETGNGPLFARRPARARKISLCVRIKATLALGVVVVAVASPLIYLACTHPNALAHKPAVMRPKWTATELRHLATALKGVLEEDPALPTEHAFFTQVAAWHEVLSVKKRPWRAIKRQMPLTRTASLDERPFLKRVKQQRHRQLDEHEQRSQTQRQAAQSQPAGNGADEGNGEEEKRELQLLDVLDSKRLLAASETGPSAQDESPAQPVIKGTLRVEVPLIKLDLADKHQRYDRSKPTEAWPVIRKLVEVTLSDQDRSWKSKREGPQWKKYMKRQTFESIAENREVLVRNCVATYNLRVLEYHERPETLKLTWEKGGEDVGATDGVEMGPYVIRR